MNVFTTSRTTSYIRVSTSNPMKRLMCIIGTMDKLVESDMTSVISIRLMSVTRD